MKEQKTLAKNVKRYRQVKGLTQEDLAEKVSLAKDTISLLESGKQENIGMKHLVSISRELDIELFELFMENPDTLFLKFVVSDQNLRSLEKLFTEIIRTSGKKLGSKGMVRLSLELG